MAVTSGRNDLSSVDSIDDGDSIMFKNDKELYDAIDYFFGNDHAKTKLWFGTSNPLLGHISPNDMISLGRGDKLKKFVYTCLEDNYG